MSATVPTAVGDYTVKASIPAKGHYKAAEATKDFTITKKDIIISGIKAAKIIQVWINRCLHCF